MTNMLPTSEKPKEIHIVKIAVELESKQHSPQLIKFDRRTPLTGIIQDLCQEWLIGDHENYALQFDKTNKSHYVTEKNRGDVNNGCILTLRHSPAKTSAHFLDVLRSAENDATAAATADRLAELQQLVTFSADPTFAAEFITMQGFKLLVGMIENGECSGEVLKYVLLSFVELMEHGNVMWNNLGAAFIERNLQCVNATAGKVPAEAVQAALSNLENIVQHTCDAERLAFIERLVTFDTILRLLRDSDAPVTQQNTLALVNALFAKAADRPERRREIAAEFSSKQYRVVLLQIISGTVGTEMAHQLYVLQTLMMNMLETRMNTPASGLAGGGGVGAGAVNNSNAIGALTGGGGISSTMTSSQSGSFGGQQATGSGASGDHAMAHEKIAELRKIAFNSTGDGSDAGHHHHHHNGSDGSGPTSNTGGNTGPRSKQQALAGNYKKLGFRCDLNPVQDFDVTPPGMLALDCMLYFARNYAAAFSAIVHENSCRPAEHECPFGRTAIELVRVLCDILRIGEPPSDQGQDYCTMFFAHDHPFEETFCASCTVLHRTWKDMRATGEDFSKVSSVLREQITRTLGDRPVSLDDFRAKIAHYTYATITTLRQQERTSKEECKSSASAIVNLKEKITPEIMQLIRQQRLNYLKEGTRFSRYNHNSRAKDKYWYARLSANNKVIHYGDCDEKTVPEDLGNKLLVSECKQLLVGTEVPQSKSKKTAVALSFSIVYDNDSRMESLDFVAPDESVFEYWTDGLYALLNQPMKSRRLQDDLETLLSMDIKLRLLDTEGVDISREPPPVPEDPDNYDFCFES